LVENFSSIVEYFRYQKDLGLLRSLLSVKTPAVNILAEKLLIAAAETENTIVIKEVFNTSTDPNI
jgi:hypothetical protein